MIKQKTKHPDIPEETIPDIGNFPVSIFPDDVIRILKLVETSMNHPIDITGSTLINVFGGMIGNKIKLKMMPGWEAPAIFWTAVVGASGAAKSHPVSFIMDALDQIDKRAYKDYKYELDKYDAWQNESEEIRKMSKQQKPKLTQIIVRDTTMEALHATHDYNKNGLIMYRDELKGWLSSMNSYRQGGDEETWLEIFNNKVASVGRVTKDPLRIDNSFVNVIGTIQDSVLSKIISKENGLVERFLYTKTYKKIEPLSRVRMKQVDIDYLYDAINQIYTNIKTAGEDIIIEVEDEMFDLIIEADKKIIVLQESGNENERFIGYLSKMRTYLPRFILVICVIDDCFNDNNLQITKDHISKAEQLLNYYIKSARKLFVDINNTIELKELINTLNGKTSREKVMELHLKNYNNVSISKALGISRQRVGKILSNK